MFDIEEILTGYCEIVFLNERTLRFEIENVIRDVNGTAIYLIDKHDKIVPISSVMILKPKKSEDVYPGWLNDEIVRKPMLPYGL